MSQTTMTAAGTAGTGTPGGGGQGAARPGVAGMEPPDLLFIVRHYRWLLIIGPVVGFLVGLGLWYGFLKWNPRYTVYAQFQVLPAYQPDIVRSPEARGAVADTPEEIGRFIRRQMLFVKSDPVLEKALRTNAFQQDPRDVRQPSGWLRENSAAPKVRLKEQLDVSPVSGSDVFQVGMQGSDRRELAVLVNAVADTYYAELTANDITKEAKELDDLKTMQTKLAGQIKDGETVLADFRTQHDISAMTRAYELTGSMLNQLNLELVKAETEAQAAKTSLEMVKKQFENNTLTLSPDGEAYVENDMTVRNLEMQKLGLEQEKAVTLNKFGAEHPLVKAIDTRIASVVKQGEEARETLRRAARLRMQESAQNLASATMAHQQDVRERRERQDRQLKDLDRWLVEYQVKKADLDAARDMEKKVSDEVTMRELKTRRDAVRVRPFLPAQVPDVEEVSFPLLRTFLPVGSVLGLVLAFALAYGLELTNTRVRTPRDITRLMQLPLLGYVPDQEDDSFLNGSLATSIRTSPGSMTAESYRQIRGRLAAEVKNKPLSTLLVASVSPGGGATTVASNLANGLALNDLRVLLVDANFYRPGLKGLYSNIPMVGLSDVLSGQKTVETAAVASTELPGLHLMGAGSRPAAAASELLTSRVFTALLAEVKAKYDVVIFDGAPMNLVGDSITLGGRLDGVVAVVRAGTVSRGTVTRVREQLKSAHANLFGIVLNAAQARGSGYFKENYRTFYQYATPPVAGATAAS